MKKKKYRTLKAQGKSEEALKAFKRGKELERQASALELSLRKNRRKVLSSSSMPEILESNDESVGSGRRKGKLPQKGKERDDLSAELKELGWSDMDLRDADKKPATTTLEGELSSLIGEVSKIANTGSGSSAIDKTQVIAHKRKALALKREGKLAEAKEELKMAKALEKKLEEEEFLADAEDSDDELTALIRSMDNDKHDNLSAKEPSLGFGLDSLMDFSDDLGTDGNLEVTDHDMDDPEIAAALKSLGWADDAKHHEDVKPQLVVTVDKEALSREIQGLKREALKQKRAGNSAEALELLRKSKLLEKDLENHATDSTPHVVENVEKGSAVESASSLKFAPKSRLAIQKELLGLKKRALALRREGKMDEADEELRKGKLLEQQLEEIDNASKKVVEAPHVNASDVTVPDLAEEGDADVTDQDMNDPAYLALLSNLGWKEEDDKDIIRSPPKASNASSAASSVNTTTRVTRRSKGEIQKELLGLKRKALALRRQGESDEAEELLQKAKELEAQLAEMEAPEREDQSESKRIKTESTTGRPHGNTDDETDSVVVNEEDMRDPALLSVLENLGWKDEVESRVDNDKTTPDKGEDPRDNKPRAEKSEATTVSQNDESSIRQEILLLKRKALALKREGKLAEAREELRQAKVLEKTLEDDDKAHHPSTTTSSSEVSNVVSSSSSTVPVVQKEKTSPSKPMSGRDRFKLQQESLGHKRLALKLRREGRTEEADAEFELAKALEAQLEESTAADSASKPVDDVSVEDFLDPQLMSALKAIGIENNNNATSSVTQVVDKPPEPVKSVAGNKQEMKELQEQIKAERVKAVNFKRSGKQAEALGALRRAKVLEKKLNSLSSS